MGNDDDVALGGGFADNVDDDFFVAGRVHVDHRGLGHATSGEAPGTGLGQVFKNARQQPLARFGAGDFRSGDTGLGGGPIDNLAIHVTKAEFLRDRCAEILAARPERARNSDNVEFHVPPPAVCIVIQGGGR